MIDSFGLKMDVCVGTRRTEEKRRDVDVRGPAALGEGFGPQKVRAADQLGHGTHAETRHIFPKLLGDKEHEILHIFWLPTEAFAQLRVLRCNAHWTGVQIADTHHDAAHRHQRRCGKSKFFRAQDRRDSHISAAHQLAVGFQANTAPETIQDQRLMGFGQSQFPGESCVMDAGTRRGARAAITARDQNDLGAGFGHASRDGTHTGLTDQLHTDAGVSIGVLQVIDEFRQILDRIDIVMRRWRDQAHPGGRMPGLRDPGIDLISRELSAFARLRTLGHLDLDLFRTDQILTRHAKSSAGHLLDGAAAIGFSRFDDHAGEILAAFSSIALGMQIVHGDCQGLVRFLGDGTIAHGAGLEALYNLRCWLYLGQRNAAILWEIEFQETAQMHGRVVFLIDLLRILMEQLIILLPHGLLQ